MLKYLKYAALSAIAIGSYAITTRGGHWLWAGPAITLLLMVGADELLPEDHSEPSYRRTWFLDAMLYMQLPLLLVLTGLSLFSLGRAAGAPAARWLIEHGADLDPIALHGAWYDWIAVAITLSLSFGGSGTNAAHELVHRTRSRSAQVVGRWLLAFTGDASFAIEHVYGHHRNVATRADPATARRGESLYRFMLRSTLRSYASAWQLESRRLQGRGQSVWNPLHSRMIRGNLMTCALLFGAWAIGGPLGLLLFATGAALGKGLLESVNYIEHYGLVRDPQDRVAPRHSWNANKRVGLAVLFALSRHSHHHAEAGKPYWALRSYPDAPTLPHGYLSMMLIALVPPVFARMMTPKLIDWDRRYASPRERELAAQASRDSGLRGLQAA